jgi:hypothetical protein
MCEVPPNYYRFFFIFIFQLCQKSKSGSQTRLSVCVSARVFFRLHSLESLASLVAGPFHRPCFILYRLFVLLPFWLFCLLGVLIIDLVEQQQQQQPLRSPYLLILYVFILIDIDMWSERLGVVGQRRNKVAAKNSAPLQCMVYSSWLIFTFYCYN